MDPKYSFWPLSKVNAGASSKEVILTPKTGQVAYSPVVFASLRYDFAALAAETVKKNPMRESFILVARVGSWKVRATVVATKSRLTLFLASFLRL